ncbi:hypothetical protein LCGC14_1827040, partial [marine sediment metagenome]
MNIKLKIPKVVLDFFMEAGNLILLNHEAYSYMAYPWFKIRIGSNEIEILHQGEFPTKLREALHGKPRKG